MIAGVPVDEEPSCEGDAVRNSAACSASDAMSIRLEAVESEDGESTISLGATCVETDGFGNVIASAEPARRLAEIVRAQSDSQVGRGCLSSICDANWTPSITRFTERIFARGFDYPYFRNELWTLLPSEDRAATECDNCGRVENLTLKMERILPPNTPAEERCPASWYAGIDATERGRLLRGTVTQTWDDSLRIDCIIPQLSVPLSCADTSEECADPEE